MTTYYKLVKGATKVKMAPPKQKYIDPILLGTSNPRDFEEIVRALGERIDDSAWTVVFKSLAVAHLMIRDGDKDVALEYFARSPEFFDLRGLARSYSTRSGDLQALERYGQYLKVRSIEFGKIRKDYVRTSNSSLKKFDGNDSSKCLEHVESLEVQIGCLIKNRYSQYDLNNDLVMFAFKMLVQDLLALYNALNEGIITLLESFFELTHSNAERTLKLYKRFVQLTENVVRYLKSAKAVGLKIPVIKHITTKLISSLEEHLREDPGNKGTTFSQDDKTQVQNDLDKVRQQRIALENQIKHQSILQTQQTGYNPFASTPMTLQSPQFDNMPSQVANTSNPFQQYQSLQPQMTQPQMIQAPTLDPQMTQQATFQLPQQTGYNPFLQDINQPMQQPVQQQQMPQQMQQQQMQQQQMPQQMQQQQMQQQQMQQQQMPQQMPQQMQQQQMPQQMQQQMQQPMQLQNALTGVATGMVNPMNSFTNTQVNVPMNTGMALNSAATAPIVATQTGTNNPFSFENVQQQKLQRQQTNPFSLQNYSDVSKNPFSLMSNSQAQAQLQQNQTRANTFAGLEHLPTIPVFPQTQLQQGFQNAANQRSQNEHNLIDI